ncbi:hypothetical protein R1flu_026361 [Riccia fluitans]|uniref:Secreted protein n=1 Tax=Riccia fluitans TaxID=41844 RepID=A0ABD1XGH4_9MARC
MKYWKLALRCLQVRQLVQVARWILEKISVTVHYPSKTVIECPTRLVLCLVVHFLKDPGRCNPQSEERPDACTSLMPVCHTSLLSDS